VLRGDVCRYQLFHYHGRPNDAIAKAQIADRIRKVEDGVDQFRKYLESRGENAQSRADSAQSSGATTRRQRSNSANTQAQGNQAKQTKDDLENAMDDLDRTTNRLRRKFDATSNYLETKAQMEQVMDSARHVNQVMVKGNYGTQAQNTGPLCARTSMILRGAAGNSRTGPPRGIGKSILHFDEKVLAHRGPLRPPF